MRTDKRKLKKGTVITLDVETKPSQQECSNCQHYSPGKSIMVDRDGNCIDCGRDVQPPKSSDLTNGKTAINKSASKSGKLINKQEKADLTVESSEGWDRELDAIQSSIWKHIYDVLEEKGIKLNLAQSYIVGSSIKEILHPRVQALLSQQQKEVEDRVRRETIDKAFDWIWDGWNLNLANKDRAKEQFLTSIKEKGGKP